jgi:hypothetical protein
MNVLVGQAHNRFCALHFRVDGFDGIAYNYHYELKTLEYLLHKRFIWRKIIIVERVIKVVTTIEFVVLSAILGVVGQGIREIVEINKKINENKNWDNLKELLPSYIIALIIGGIAGALGFLVLSYTEITKDYIITFIAIGYAGTDFLEGLLLKKVPQ